MPTIVAIKHQFDALPDEVKSHLRDLKPLITEAKVEVALALAFMIIEQGRYRAIKCALVRKLKCNSAIVDNLLGDKQLTRKEFRSVILRLTKIDIQKDGMQVLQQAETSRDLLLHGRKPSAAQMRQAISHALTFIEVFGAKMKTSTKKNPFGDLRGLTSRIRVLSAEQSKWIVRGVLHYGEKETAN